MLKMVAMIEGATPSPKGNHSCYFVSLTRELRAGRTFKRKGVAGRKDAVQFMWQIINDTAKGEHQHDAYGEITSQKLFAVEFNSPKGEFASVLFAHVDSDEELTLVRKVASKILEETYAFLNAAKF